ncbi:MAG: acyl--CoA ligase [Spirochaetales bacterium]|nr:acyl--CoA ligase [Spirochaetales bacterium]
MNRTKLNSIKELYEAFIAEIPDNKGVICFHEKEYSRNEFSNLIDHYIRHLKALGIGPSMGVGYTLPNCPEVLALFFAICRLGAFAIPIFHMTPDQTKLNILRQARAALVISNSRLYASLAETAAKEKTFLRFALIDQAEGIYSLAAPAPLEQNNEVSDLDPELPALMATSSGTTGIPKPVMMNQRNIAAVIKASIALAGDPKRYGNNGFSTVMAFPLSTAGVLVVSGVMMAGLRCVFSDDMSPLSFLEMIRHWKAESMSAPPSYFEAIIGLPHIDSFERSTIRNIMTGMDFFSPGLMERLRAKFPRLDSFGNGYGLIETSNVFMVGLLQGEELSGPTNNLRIAPDTGNMISIRDNKGKELEPGLEGELWVKGPSVIKGYLGNPEATAQAFCDGWFKTGDIAKQSAPDRVSLLGRNKYLIKRGGKSVSPILVQNTINEVKGIIDSAVVGVPHNLYGQMVWAFVVSKESNQESEKAIMKHCRKNLSNYMIPDHIIFIDKIPKNPGVGKVNYEALIDQAKEELRILQGE